MTKAHHLIQDPANWCQGSMARNINNLYRDPKDPDATKFCMLGALYWVYGESEGDQYEQNVARVRSQLEGLPVSYLHNPDRNEAAITKWNDKDGRTHQEVYRVLKNLDL